MDADRRADTRPASPLRAAPAACRRTRAGSSDQNPGRRKLDTKPHDAPSLRVGIPASMIATVRAVRVTAPPARPDARTRPSAGFRLARRFPDVAFRATALAFALSVFGITGLIAFTLLRSSWPSLAAFGWHFLWTSTWDPVFLKFGALPFIYGTLATSTLALLIAVPVGLGAAICLAELLPERVADPLTFLIELLVAVPSVVYGLVGVFVLVPVMRTVGGPIQTAFGAFPLFSGPVYGVGLLTAAIVLAVMIVPFIVAVSREV